MAISLTKTIPASSSFSGYSSGGSTTITLRGVIEIIMHTKKEMIKINTRKSKNTEAAAPSDTFPNKVVDLKNGTDEIVIRGWLEDDASLSAWEKFWKIRAMCVAGSDTGKGALASLVIDDITFNSSSQEAFLEDVVATIPSTDSGTLNTNNADDRARIEIALSFFIGAER